MDGDYSDSEEEKAAVFGSLGSFVPASDVPGGCLLHVQFVTGAAGGNENATASLHLAPALLPKGCTRATITSIALVGARSSVPLETGFFGQFHMRSVGLGSENEGSEQIWTTGRTTAIVAGVIAGQYPAPLTEAYEVVYIPTRGEAPRPPLVFYTAEDTSEDAMRLARVNLGHIMKLLTERRALGTGRNLGWVEWAPETTVVDGAVVETHESAYIRVVVAEAVSAEIAVTRPETSGDGRYFVHIGEALAFVKQLHDRNPFTVNREGAATDTTAITLSPVAGSRWPAMRGVPTVFTLEFQINFAECSPVEEATHGDAGDTADAASENGTGIVSSVLSWVSPA